MNLKSIKFEESKEKEVFLNSNELTSLNKLGRKRVSAFDLNPNANKVWYIGFKSIINKIDLLVR